MRSEPRKQKKVLLLKLFGNNNAQPRSDGNIQWNINLIQ